MDFTNSLFITGVIIGLGVAAPIGPIATLIIRQTLAYGMLSGLVAGLAATIADGFYAGIAALLSSYIEGWMNAHFRWFYFMGGAFLMYIGVGILRSHINYNKNDKKNLDRALTSSFFHTLFLTLASPMTTLLFVGWFNGTGVFEKITQTHDIITVVLGVMFGAMAWWVLLTAGLSSIQKKFDLKVFKYVNLISGSGIIVFSLITIGQAILGIK